MKLLMITALVASIFAVQAEAKMTCAARVDAQGNSNSGAGIVLPMKFSYEISGKRLIFSDDSGVQQPAEPVYSVNSCVGTLVKTSYKLEGSSCVPNRATVKNHGHTVVLTDNPDGEFAYYDCQ